MNTIVKYPFEKIEHGLEPDEKLSRARVFVEDVLPEYVVDFEIDNENALEEDFVLERDWEE